MPKPFALLLAVALAALPLSAAAAVVRPSDETLLVAAQNGMEELVIARVRGGANIDSCDHRQRTALMLAARHNNVRTVALLLENGADPELVDSDGHTAAMWAARRGHVTALHTILHHLEGTPAFERQARLALGMIQRVGDRRTEAALRELYPNAIGRGGAPAPTIPTFTYTPPPASAGSSPWGGTERRFDALPAGGAREAAPAAAPTRVIPTPPPMVKQPVGWPFAPPTAAPNDPLSELPPIPTPPPEPGKPTP